MKLYQGCDLLLFATIENDNSLVYQASKPQKLGALQGVLLPSSQTVNLINKDGLPFDSYTTELQGYSVQIDTEGLDDDFISYLTGNGENGSGFHIDTGESINRFFALGFRILDTNKTHKYMWFLKGRFQLLQRTIRTKQGTEATGTSLVYFPVFTEHKFKINGKIARSITVDESKLQRDVNAEYWASVVWTPDNLMPIEKPLIYPDTDSLSVGENIIITEPNGANIEYEVIE